MARRKSRKKKVRLTWPLILLIVVAVIVVFILTPVENPLADISSGLSYDIKLELPANDGNIIYHPDFYLSYSEEDEQARWVATVLTANHVLTKSVERTDKFIKDPEVITGSAVTGDYAGTGYDRGHILSFASNGWNDEVGAASFYMSNMSPMTPNTNRKVYLRLEEAERVCTVQNGVLFVVSGPILTDGPYKKIGKDNLVSVPNYYFKVFLDYTGSTHKAIGFIIPNDDDSTDDLSQYACTVNDIEKLSGLDFWPLIPDSEEEKLENQCNLEDWDLSTFNRSKVAERYGYDLDNLSFEEISYDKPVPKDLKEEILCFLYQNFAQYKIQILAIFSSFKS